MAFDFQTIRTKMDQTTALNQVDSLLNGQFDPNDAGQLLEMQAALQEWSLIVNLQASTIKSFTDTMKQVVAKY